MKRFVVPAMSWRYPSGRHKEVIVGYYTRGSRPAGSRLAQYQSWREHVRASAAKVGFKLPLMVLEHEPIYVYVVAYFVDRRHPDVENVRKGIVDALFYVTKAEKQLLGEGAGSDKWVAGAHSLPRYDKEDSRVEVFVLTPKEWARVFNLEVLDEESSS